MQKSFDTVWANWKDLLDQLKILDEVSFEPVPNVDCSSEPQSNFAFCNPRLNPQDRATDLVSRLSLQELIDQNSASAPAIPRLGINAYNWKSNCLHGWSKLGRSDWFGYTWTVFPAPIGLGATFNPQLVQKVGQITADEGRALHNLLLVHFNGDSVEGGGLNCFGPNVNLLTDPRLYYAQETYGEDPLIVSKLGVAYTIGLQGKSDKYFKVGASSKYFPMPSCPGELPLTTHDLYDTYLPAFKSLILAGNVTQVVASNSSVRCKLETIDIQHTYNYFLKTILRHRFGAENISVCSTFASMSELAATMFINATTDIDLGDETLYLSELEIALREGSVVEQTIRNSVWRSFYLRIRLGDFDPPELVPYQYIDATYLNKPAHQTMNLRAARESIVLLRNQGNLLPLHTDSLNKLAVIGPNANATSALLSPDGGIPAFVISVLQGIRETVNNTHVDIDYQPGCVGAVCSDTSLFEQAIAIVHDADFVIMVMGLDHTIENRDHGRVSTTCDSVPVDILALPGCQERLIEEIIDYNSHVILILINGGPISIPKLYMQRGVVAIIEAFYPGPLGGRAVSDVLFGRYNPGGRMPYTTFYSSKDILPSISHSMYEAPGQTYRYFSKEPLIPFGYGLSYSEFEYFSLDVPTTRVKPCDGIKVSVSVQNVGEVEGDEVIQVYIEPPRILGKPFIPNVQLVAFERVNIHPQVVHVASFELNSYLLSVVDHDGERYIFPGEYTLVVTGGLEGKELNCVFSIDGSATNIQECPAISSCLAC